MILLIHPILLMTFYCVQTINLPDLLSARQMKSIPKDLILRIKRLNVSRYQCTALASPNRYRKRYELPNDISLISSKEHDRHAARQLVVCCLKSSGSLLNLGCANIGRSPHFAVSLHGSDEVMLHGKEGSRCPSGDRNLVVDVLDMVVDGLLGDREQPADRPSDSAGWALF
jgi:hypothetical protein